jgi:hypothetical protein
VKPVLLLNENCGGGLTPTSIENENIVYILRVKKRERKEKTSSDEPTGYILVVSDEFKRTSNGHLTGINSTG